MMRRNGIPNKINFLSQCNIAFLLCIPLTTSLQALTYDISEDTQIVGEVFTVFIEPGDTLKSIARKYDIGYEEIIRANRHLNVSNQKNWSKVVIPSAFVLPSGPKEGIIINLPEMRLYYYPPNEDVVMTYPIGVGRQGWKTPVGKTTILNKEEDPKWYVPKSIKEYMFISKGIELPDIMPAGPKNPLGKHALRLALHGYLIHGTNKPSSVGKRSSSGCIRMLPEDVEELFDIVPVGTRVTITNQPFKAGWYKGEFYVEAHRPFWDQLPKQRKDESNLRVTIRNGLGTEDINIDWEHVFDIVKQYTGYPQYVSRYE